VRREKRTSDSPLYLITVTLKFNEYDTPALLLDMDIAERNIRRMAEFFHGKKLHHRPHVKVHKSPYLAHKQIAAGAKGVTCAKVAEAEVMANSGIDNILIANQVIGAQKLTRLANLGKHCHIGVLVDNLANAKEMSEIAANAGSNIDVLVEVNLSSSLDGILDRCGVASGKDAVKLAHEISQLKNLNFNGLMGYEGALRKFTDTESRKNAVEKALGFLVGIKDQVEDSGIDVNVVSSGGTMSYNLASQVPGVTEIQAGGYVFMDTGYRKAGIDFGIALTLLTTVISRPKAEKAIVDVGFKAISAEHGMPLIKDRADLECISLNAEHGHLRLREAGIFPSCGDKVEMLPSHVDTTVCLHDNYVVTRGGEVEGTLAIEARGKLQ